ncbi:MAG: COX15/CtaA family protein, partial [Bacteroidota bacterium]
TFVTEYNKRLHWFAVFTAIGTFCLIIAGGLVTSTGSGLAVPDWPLSYGQLMPPMVGGIFYEHSHRLVATTVGLLTIIITIWIWKKEQRRWVKILGLFTLATIVVQGALGGLTVLMMLPTAVSVTHATLAQTFFCLVSTIALVTSRWWTQTINVKLTIHPNKTTLILSISISFIVYIQLVLGALVRHTGSGLAVPDFPLAYGQLLPSLSDESLEQYNRYLIYEDMRLAADGPITKGQVIIHMLHRYWAIFVSAGIVLLITRLWRERWTIFKVYSFLLSILIFVQILLGAFTVLSQKSIEIATAHVSVGALLLVCTFLATMSVSRISLSSVHFRVEHAREVIA